jgi:predicted  nucleic acid-binding Zn-ribbon protein
MLILVFSGCNSNKNSDKNILQDEYETLQAERDSLAYVQQTLQEEIEQYFSTINLIELNIEKIKNAEKLITLQPFGTDVDLDTRNKINDDLAFINEMLKANKEEINILKNKLKNSPVQSSQLQQTIDRLDASIEEERKNVQNLLTAKANKDSLIKQLSDDLDTLSSNIEDLESEKSAHMHQIKEQEEAMHTAWYIFGSKKELEEQNVITPGGWFRPDRILDGDFNKKCFVRVDARRTKTISLYSSRANILSTHPASAYELKKESGTVTLYINDTDAFWQISKYLVIEVD